jgi:hypothetical protein
MSSLSHNQGRRYAMNFFEDGMNVCANDDPARCMNVEVLMLFQSHVPLDGMKKAFCKVNFYLPKSAYGRMRVKMGSWM